MKLYGYLIIRIHTTRETRLHKNNLHSMINELKHHILSDSGCYELWDMYNQLFDFIVTE